MSLLQSQRLDMSSLVNQTEESREVNNTFPEALKEPILRRIQFSTVSRVDNLGMYPQRDFQLNCANNRFFTVDEIYEVSSLRRQ
jgi:hypothetical protein